MDYKPEEDSNYLTHWDTNNLYGWVVSQNLPCKVLRWGKVATLKKVLKTPDDGPKGYIVEVDLDFPQHLHGKFKEFPPGPESLTPKTASSKKSSEPRAEQSDTTNIAGQTSSSRISTSEKNM